MRKEQAKINLDLWSAGTSASPLIAKTIALSVEKQIKVIIPVLHSNLPVKICASFSDEQMNKIKNRKRYVRKQKADTSRDNELDLLGDEDVDSFAGSQADLEGAAAQLFASPPRPQPLRFESLSLTTPAKSPTNPRYCLTAENRI